MPQIALIGDHDPAVKAHQAIPRALALAGATYSWCHTSDIGPLDHYQGIWCVPASPYANEAAALDAIRYARENQIPFLGTCGGFQHAIVEFARNVLGWDDAHHAETSDTGRLVITRLTCSLVEVENEVTAIKGTRFEQWYGPEPQKVGYHCNYGLAPAFEAALAAHGLLISARDAQGEPRAFELLNHPFFAGTLFQPERLALGGRLSPVIAAFAAAARKKI